MINWSGPVLAVTTNEATWLNDPKWTQAYTYKQVGAGDILFRNGVFHTYWNGIGHAYSATPLGPYKEGSISEPFDDYGIDVQVFQDEDGEIYWVKKRNPADPHPLTGANSNLDGPETWAFKMNSVFSRKDITVGSVQLTHQRGHSSNLNHVNFEGPELFKHRGRYYQVFASNRMGPRSGMYQVGAAESDQPMNFNNSKKYPHPILIAILNSICWTTKRFLTVPNMVDGIVVIQQELLLPIGKMWALMIAGGLLRKVVTVVRNMIFCRDFITNAKIRARKTVWNTTKLYVRRKFTLSEVPAKIALKHWVFADANFYINGNQVTIKARNNTYQYLQLDPAFLWLVKTLLQLKPRVLALISIASNFWILDCMIQVIPMLKIL